MSLLVCILLSDLVLLTIVSFILFIFPVNLSILFNLQNLFDGVKEFKSNSPSIEVILRGHKGDPSRVQEQGSHPVHIREASFLLLPFIDFRIIFYEGLATSILQKD